MQPLKDVLQQLIRISDQELDDFLQHCIEKKFKKQENLSRPGIIPNEIFFIKQGLIRVIITDQQGADHSLHFAMENQFIADYSCFMQKRPSIYTLQAIEETEVVVMPRSLIEWGYQHLQEGQKLGRLIAESYFIYHDSRISDQYARNPKERYDAITEVFPNIHNRVPQHMIASYLGISPVHLSRLKKEAGRKI